MRTVSVRQLAALMAIIAAVLTWTSSAAPIQRPPHPPPTPRPPHPPAPAPGPRPAGCGRVVGNIRPCMPFVRGKAKEPSKGCCRGTKRLSDNANTPELRKQACECIVRAMKRMTGVQTSLIAQVPKKCGIKTNLPPIDANFDCSKITSTIYGGYY